MEHQHITQEEVVVEVQVPLLELVVLEVEEQEE